MKLLKKVQYNSPVVLTFTFIALIAMILGMITGKNSTALLFSVYRDSLLNPLFYLRLFTHVLGHADWGHYTSNFMIILLIGPILEEKYGSKKILYMIILTAFITGLINVIFFPTSALLGASGIAFMLILLSSFTNFKSGTIPLTFIVVSIAYIGNEIMKGVFSNDNISQITHIIGGICGAFFGYLMSKNKQKTM